MVYTTFFFFFFFVGLHNWFEKQKRQSVKLLERDANEQRGGKVGLVELASTSINTSTSQSSWGYRTIMASNPNGSVEAMDIDQRPQLELGKSPANASVHHSTTTQEQGQVCQSCTKGWRSSWQTIHATRKKLYEFPARANVLHNKTDLNDIARRGLILWGRGTAARSCNTQLQRAPNSWATRHSCNNAKRQECLDEWLTRAVAVWLGPSRGRGCSSFSQRGRHLLGVGQGMIHESRRRLVGGNKESTRTEKVGEIMPCLQAKDSRQRVHTHGSRQWLAVRRCWRGDRSVLAVRFLLLDL